MLRPAAVAGTSARAGLALARSSLRADSGGHQVPRGERLRAVLALINEQLEVAWSTWRPPQPGRRQQQYNGEEEEARRGRGVRCTVDVADVADVAAMA
jgi:hypothetical protein